MPEKANRAFKETFGILDECSSWNLRYTRANCGLNLHEGRAQIFRGRVDDICWFSWIFANFYHFGGLLFLVLWRIVVWVGWYSNKNIAK